jgi:UDP:flavonoid glycosyltransferase YjiC (YdhE family)
VPEWFNQLDKTKPIIYVTVGGAAGHDGAGDFFRIVAEGLSDVNAQIIVSTGGKLDPAEIPFKSPNIRWERWVPTQKMLDYCDLIVFHGGYGTRMQVVEKGLPSIVIPFHSEQEYSGRQLVASNAAKLLHYSTSPYTCITAKWRGGKLLKRSPYTVQFRLDATLEPEQLSEVVEDALNNPKLRDGVKALQEELKPYGGCEQAIDLISQRLNIEI